MNNFYNHYYRYYNPYIPRKFPDDDVSNENDFEKKNISSKYYSFGPLHFKIPFSTDIEEPIFEIFGISLYLDDIIIIGLLFFLYQEGVQDELLFIILILLLLG